MIEALVFGSGFVVTDAGKSTHLPIDYEKYSVKLVALEVRYTCTSFSEEPAASILVP
jgi:hypothetical protein